MRDFSIESLRSLLSASFTRKHEYTNRIDKALVLAYHAHQSQVREHREPDTAPIPYITHPVGVAVIAAEFWEEGELDDAFEDMICAALTHDVLEDTDVDPAELQRQTSLRCLELVLSLTKPLVDVEFSRDVRNKLFAAQIEQAGSTARYLKLCDAAHNLDRPDAMPENLLIKTVDKVTKFYLPMAKGEPFELRLTKLLTMRVAKARQCDHFKNAQPTKLNNIGLDEFFKLCEKRASGKVLEEHDVEALLLSLDGVLGVIVVSSAEFGTSWLKNVDERTLGKYSSVSKFSRSMTAEISFPRSEVALNSLMPQAADVVLLSPLYGQVGDASHSVVHCILEQKKRPAWLSVSVFYAVISVLCSRLRARKARELSDMTTRIMRSRLQLDPSVALQFNLSSRQLTDIKQIIDRGRFVESGLCSLVQELLVESSFDESHAVLTSRTKAADSLLRKKSERKLLHLTDADDVVGLRVVLISKTIRDRFVASLMGALGESARNSRLPVAIDYSTLTEALVSSSSGYRSVHIRFRTRSDRIYNALGIEIQVRTLQEDAWARISQYAEYHTDPNRSKKRTTRQLKKLADLRDEAEKEILHLG